MASTLLPQHRAAIDVLIRAACDDLCSSEEASSSSASSSQSASSSSSSSRLSGGTPSLQSSPEEKQKSQNNARVAAVLQGSDFQTLEFQAASPRSVSFDPETARNANTGSERSEHGIQDASSSSFQDTGDEEEEEDDDEDDEDFDLEQTNSSGEMQEGQTKASRGGRAPHDTGVRRLRFVVLLLLVASGVSISVATYYSLRDQQASGFEQDFAATVTSMTDEVISRSAVLEHDFDALASRYTIEEFTSQRSFPEVTVPYFEVSGADVRQTPYIELVAYAPFISSRNEKDSWEEYAADHHLGWLHESLDVYDGDTSHRMNFTEFIYRRDTYGHTWHSSEGGPWLPVWQVSPPVGMQESVNFDLLSVGSIEEVLESVQFRNAPVLSPIIDTKTFRLESNDTEVPKGVLMHPVYSTIDKRSSKMVGVLVGIVAWEEYLANGLTRGDDQSVVVSIPDTKGNAYMYELQGPSIRRVSEPEGTYLKDRSATIPLFTFSDAIGNATTGPTITVYASTSYASGTPTWIPAAIASAVAAGFALINATFILYDRYIQQKNAELRGAADRSRALVTSLFPATVHDRLFNDANGVEATQVPKKKKTQGQEAAKMFADAGAEDANESSTPSTAEDDSAEVDDDDVYFKSKPIADHFPNTTILFADIAGFTAWSASREPHDVFVLLETIYHAFDVIAKRRGVFKVETVGDCYVAVTGLPKPRKDHAVVMVKFARECLRKMSSLTKKLEVRLGPDVSDLCMRVGIHSGSVTGGVLRGEGSRFQLFGDSMNTASRIETSGEPNRIHLSPTTAELLKEAGKGKWIRERANKVTLKGKGEMQTYWLKCGKGSSQDRSRSRNDEVGVDHDDASDSDSDSDESYSDDESLLEDDLIQTMVSEKTARLIEWNVEVLHRLLKQNVARRPASDATSAKSHYWKTVGKSDSLLEETWESILLPPYDPAAKALSDDEIDAIRLDNEVYFQLKDFVTNVAIMHRDNPYHNFEHSSHACMHVTKYLSRISTRIKEGANNPVLVKSLHDRTFRIVSDPMTEFALVFASLILSIDHPGVPNSQVVKEKKEMARAFGGKSITQSNAFLLAWDLLLDADYKELRQAICSTKDETRRFRQIVVNCVMATDTADKDLQVAREHKWSSAFSAAKRQSLGESSHSHHRDSMAGQVTSVAELLVQSADLAHTMQHYQVFCKWNERRFMEAFKAYRAGRSEENPADVWYESQLSLYNDLVLPMATKIRDCGIFGSSSDEMLDFATKNRYLWKVNGAAAVRQMAEQAERSYPVKGLVEPVPRGLPIGMPAVSSSSSAAATVVWPVTAVPQPPHKPSFVPSVASIPSAVPPPASTLKIGEKDVTTASVTSALSLLMQKVQIMSQQEEALMMERSVPAPGSTGVGATASVVQVASIEEVNDCKPAANAARTSATIQSALEIIDSSLHGKQTL